MYRLLHVNYASIKFLKKMVQNKKNLDLPLFLETRRFNNSILTPLYFFPFLGKGSPESVLEIWASNGGHCSLGQQDHWLDHKRHVPGQQDLHSLFSFPCLYSNGLELTSPERQREHKTFRLSADNEFSYRRNTAFGGSVIPHSHSHWKIYGCTLEGAHSI